MENQGEKDKYENYMDLQDPAEWVKYALRESKYSSGKRGKEGSQNDDLE